MAPPGAGEMGDSGALRTRSDGRPAVQAGAVGGTRRPAVTASRGASAPTGAARGTGEGRAPTLEGGGGAPGPPAPGVAATEAGPAIPA
eukprot:1990827-Pleurochrysis_carterae.AAC.1